MYGVTPSPLSSPVHLPDTLHCANISIISASSCNKDYPGRLMNTMVCAGVESGGTGSCEVRAKGRARGDRERDRFGSWDGIRFCLLWAREDARGRPGDGEGRTVKTEVRFELETVVRLGCG